MPTGTEPRPADPHPVDARPPARKLAAFGLQHVLAMYAGAVAVPLIVGGALKLPPHDLAYLINADLLICGVATLIQCVGVRWFGAKLPLMQGVSFAAVAPMIAIGTAGGGLPAIYGAVIAAGLLMAVAAPLFGRLVRLFPPLVTGTLLLIIGISLLPVAVKWAAGGAGTPGFGTPKNVLTALGVLVFVLAAQRFLPGFLGRIGVLLGIVAGTLVAIPLGMTDFGGVTEADPVGVSTPFHFGAPVFEAGAVVSMLVVMLVAMTETTGSILALGELTGREVDRRTLVDGLRADAASTALGGLFNTFPYTAYAQNIGLVGITGVKSRWVVAFAGGVLVVLGLFPPVGALVAAIPAPVLGGAGLVMFGTVAAAGVRTLSQVRFEDNHNLVVVAASLGVGLIPVAVPEFYDRFPGWTDVVLHSGISAGCVTAIALNLLFNHTRRPEAGAEAGPEAKVAPEAAPTSAPTPASAPAEAAPA
ncbi:nucleobase:cation symporter-2 family protein [Actinomadura hibisca]|uniref:nucleobase:cation symporter-2 family protein n=1 Tax=Actinomadura hibisca TaxID=68565 RepID=UPI00082A5928|nr:nucleobase:cation symporter-2 family protein [Actinomadura hibisca]